MAIKTHKFKVLKEEARMRLDLFLTMQFPEFSRSWIQKLIEKGNVLVGRSKATKSSYKLKVGETVGFTLELPPEISLEPDRALDAKIQIIFENDDFVVINKQAGVVVHPSSSTPKGTLVNWLVWKYPDILRIGDDPSAGSGQANLRPGLVHRLDKETSGLMVIAKNQKIFRWLKNQFKDRKVNKKYLTLVVGEMKKDSGEISYPIGRSKSDPTRQVVFKGKKIPASAREALTRWQVLKRFPGFTYLEVLPKTGRMHQIRVHLKTIGHPVAGDEKYGGRKPKHLGRMFLHASFLSFTSLGGEKFSFTSPLIEDLEKALKNLPFMVV